MNQLRLSFLLLLVFIFSSLALFAREVSSPLSSLTQVIFVDDRGHPATLENRSYHLEEYTTEKAIPNNAVTLSVGEKLLIRCNDGSSGTYKIKSTDGAGVPFLEQEKEAHGYDWDIYWSVSDTGPYFLLTAEQPGSGSFNVYSYGIISASSNNQIYERNLLGTISINVNGRETQAAEARP
jgi:hypothetical protein